MNLLAKFLEFLRPRKRYVRSIMAKEGAQSSILKVP